MFAVSFHFSQAQSPAVKAFTVTIDAGHGGKDGGAPGKRSNEKDIALKLALKLGRLIETQMPDVTVYYTRKTDVFIPLYRRPQIANQNKSDIFISIHVDAVKKGNSCPTGTSSYVLGNTRNSENLDLVMQENKAILLEDDYKVRYAGFDPTSPESYILFHNVQNNNLNQSLEIASMVQDELRNFGRDDRGVHQGDLCVLRDCANPSMLVETGYICNSQEEAFLLSDEGQESIAKAIFTAIKTYKNTVDTKVNGLAQSGIKHQDSVDKQASKRDTRVSQEQALESQASSTDYDTAAESPKVVPESKKEPARGHAKNSVQPEKTVKTSQKTSGTVEYRVQIMASAKKLSRNSKDFKGVKDLDELHLDGYYKYMSKPVGTFKEAQAIRKKLSTKFKGAFIVAFKDGEKAAFDPKSGKIKK